MLIVAGAIEFARVLQGRRQGFESIDQGDDEDHATSSQRLADTCALMEASIRRLLEVW